jgi:hypothetical protein
MMAGPTPLGKFVPNCGNADSNGRPNPSLAGTVGKSGCGARWTWLARATQRIVATKTPVIPTASKPLRAVLFIPALDAMAGQLSRIGFAQQIRVAHLIGGLHKKSGRLTRQAPSGRNEKVPHQPIERPKKQNCQDGKRSQADGSPPPSVAGATSQYKPQAAHCRQTGKRQKRILGDEFEHGYFFAFPVFFGPATSSLIGMPAAFGHIQRD